MYIIYKDVKAPTNRHSRSGTSKWRDHFEAMQVGDWFVIPKKDYGKVQNAANKYLRGRYSLYKHPEIADRYVCLKRK